MKRFRTKRCDLRAYRALMNAKKRELQRTWEDKVRQIVAEDTRFQEELERDQVARYTAYDIRVQDEMERLAAILSDTSSTGYWYSPTKFLTEVNDYEWYGLYDFAKRLLKAEGVREVTPPACLPYASYEPQQSIVNFCVNY